MSRLHEHVSVDGRLVPCERATVSWCDRGLTHGLAVYETIRILDGCPVFLREHHLRVRRGLDMLGIECPLSEDELSRATLDLCGHCGVRDGSCRVLVTAGPAAGSLSVLMWVHRPEFKRGPLHTVTFRAARSAASVKSVDRVVVTLAMRRARERGADDALLVDQRGRVMEATTANVFVYAGGELVTPRLDDGVLPGVVRGALVEGATRAGLPVWEADILAEDLGSSDVVMLSSSVRGLVQCASVDGRPLGRDTMLPRLLRRLLQVAEARSAQAFRREWRTCEVPVVTTDLADS